jgi:hypothetical protein
MKRRVGDVTITKVVELELTGMAFVLPDATPDACLTHQWMKPHFMNDALARRDWAATADHDQRASTETRHRVFGSLAGTPALMIGAHFAGVTAGRVNRDGKAFRLDV